MMFTAFDLYVVCCVLYAVDILRHCPTVKWGLGQQLGCLL